MIRSDFVIKVKHQPPSREESRRWAVGELVQVVSVMEGEGMLYAPRSVSNMTPTDFYSLCGLADDLVDSLGLPEGVNDGE